MNLVAASAHSIRARSTFGTKNAPSPPGVRPVVWSIAGSDSGGGAGLQADLKALAVFGVHGCTAVAAITAQNSVAVTQVEPVSFDLLHAQLAALARDMPPHAIKTGLLGSVANVRVVCQWVDRVREVAAAQGHTVALVVDPVLGSTTGATFASAEVLQAYVDELLPRTTLVTPNRAEAARLLGYDAAVVAMADDLVLRYPQLAVAITGGDTRGVTLVEPPRPLNAHPASSHHNAALASDWLQSSQTSGWLSLPRVDTPHHHGTGCTFAATAAAALASGYCVADAVVLAKMATTHALRHAYDAGQGAGPVCAQADFAQHVGNLPALQPASPAALVPGTHGSWGASDAGFAPLLHPAMGVYAVVDSALWVRRVLASGIRTVQLRIKNPQEPSLAAQIQEAIAVARATPGAQLFINDHWQLALELGAYGVHLGQEDLEKVDLQALRQAGVRVGLSTHSYWEVCRAWALRPSYIACGPIFATHSKDMPWIPQGLANLRYWAQLLALPVVGIGGIGIHNVADVAATGVASAAVITAITQASDPHQAIKDLMAGFARGTSVNCNLSL
jgi:hydroxymethylpyrimidine kinase/phosphomethylpyrimidine kinase/thiamine-phosphate diphosphorylase